MNNVNGIIILPDDWSASNYSLNNTNTFDASYSNVISATQWTTLENTGAVFFPATGDRLGNFVGSIGNYWTSSKYDDYHASCVYFNNDNLDINSTSGRGYGLAVRLVQDYNP